MIIHISRQRIDFIKSQGYGLAVGIKHVMNVESREGDTEFHVLSDERAECAQCGGVFTSVDANSATELETIKFCASPMETVIALRDMRQQLIALMPTILRSA